MEWHIDKDTDFSTMSKNQPPADLRSHLFDLGKKARTPAELEEQEEPTHRTELDRLVDLFSAHGMTQANSSANVKNFWGVLPDGRTILAIVRYNIVLVTVSISPHTGNNIEFGLLPNDRPLDEALPFVKELFIGDYEKARKRDAVEVERWKQRNLPDQE
jgi:hypothetical protein